MECSPSLKTPSFEKLPLDIQRYIFSLLQDIKTFVSAARVNRFWSVEISLSWSIYAYNRGLLNDEKLWRKFDKDWKWICCSKMHEFQTDQWKYGVGKYSKYENNTLLWTYEGDWVENIRQGTGCISYPNGQTYHGHWKNDNLEGRGFLYFVSELSKGIYEGEFREGKKEGYGVMTWTEGKWKDDKYEGHWSNDLMHGKGKYTFASGTSYDGDWKYGKMHGNGVYLYKNGNKYIGEMYEDLKQGQGEFYYVSYGSTFTGNFVSNKPHERGVYRWEDGDWFEGEWYRGRRLGKGVLHLQDGTQIEQEWMDPTSHPYTNEEPEKFPSMVRLDEGSPPSSPFVPGSPMF